MCNAYNVTTSVDALRRLFDVQNSPNLPEYGDIYPGRPTPAIRLDGDARIVAEMRWGFVRPFSDKLNNARAETVDGKPLWAKAFRERRCLLPLDAFYEWKGPKGGKTRFAFRMPDRAPYAIAGLWEQSAGADGPVTACTMIVTEPNALVAGYHHRMPAILRPDEYGAWLVEGRKELLRPYDGDLAVEESAPPPPKKAQASLFD